MHDERRCKHYGCLQPVHSDSMSLCAEHFIPELLDALAYARQRLTERTIENDRLRAQVARLKRKRGRP